MRSALIVPLAVLAALNPVAVLSARTIEIAPSTPWNVDFGADKCRLTRLFGEGDDRHLVFFEQYGPSSEFGLTAAGPAYKRFRSRQLTHIKFFAAQERIRTEPFTGTIEGFGQGVIYTSIDLREAENDDEDGDDGAAITRMPELDTDYAAQVEFVSLQQRGDEVRLMTGPLDEAFAVLNRCAQDFVAAWGLDLEQHRTATRRPKWSNMDAVVRRIQDSYPRNAVTRGEQAIMRMRVIVSEQGTVEDCAIVKATDTEYLESPACKAMRAARFQPALDAEGEPMRSYYATTITYQIG